MTRHSLSADEVFNKFLSQIFCRKPAQRPFKASLNFLLKTPNLAIVNHKRLIRRSHTKLSLDSRYFLIRHVRENS